VFTGEEEVEGGRGDDDFGVRVAGGRVEVRDNGFYGVDCAVPVFVYALEGKGSWRVGEGSTF
jgi:hypothetical protein